MSAIPHPPSAATAPTAGRTAYTQAPGVLFGTRPLPELARLSALPCLRLC
ncbi:hypothetical protein C8E02_0676 [Vogesella indigofera]|uniref:Uncharacterized protein n=1 Tax=Vogesella indigofera TaxID=45465 RepID=A0A495BHU5_VOGIN|nr:hypothetical protein C8E02_0676 [Vogesella indigofera]